MLAVHDLCKSFHGTAAAADVSFELRSGSLGLVGEPGSGKTTIARILVGLVTPDTRVAESRGRL
ncbi:ATP-binding cassette domain-containing protein [Nonomuraea sp. H19]|uniref:ATP-binding cassette domain-containing protein n=1 Tax=Nonomuraea sp. H19 TaxID=3452206 RepID=UPI003F89799C